MNKKDFNQWASRVDLYGRGVAILIAISIICFTVYVVLPMIQKHEAMRPRLAALDKGFSWGAFLHYMVDDAQHTCRYNERCYKEWIRNTLPSNATRHGYKDSALKDIREGMLFIIEDSNSDPALQAALKTS